MTAWLVTYRVGEAGQDSKALQLPDDYEKAEAVAEALEDGSIPDVWFAQHSIIAVERYNTAGLAPE